MSANPLFGFIKPYFPHWDLRQKQTNNIALITFWSQFSSYALNSILILFLTKPLLEQGLGYSQSKAYAFMGISQATGYLMPVLGGYMADQVLGIRRSILLGSVMLAIAYLLLMLSGYTIDWVGDSLFLAAYALIPATNSLLMGSASGLISNIYSDDAIRAKSAMTFYYMAINVGGLLATVIAPSLLNSRYGPLSILTLTFVGKSIAALNFAKRYSLYDNVIQGKDTRRFPTTSKWYLFFYILGIYLFTLVAYSHVYLASKVISFGCAAGIFWFFSSTLALKGLAKTKQLIALLLIIEAVIFFIIYNQMNTTLILFAKTNSNLQLLGMPVLPAQYQMVNPILIIVLGLQLPRFYRYFPRFTIPWQFASGTILAGLALLLMALAVPARQTGYLNGNYIGLAYVMITLAELWVSAIGLSMIGLYCDNRKLAFAMGVWYLACSLSNAISGRLAEFAAIPEATSTLKSLAIYQHYYLQLGCAAITFGMVMGVIALVIGRNLRKKGVELF